MAQDSQSRRAWRGKRHELQALTATGAESHHHFATGARTDAWYRLGSISLAMNPAEASPHSTFTPPGCRLRAD